MSGIAPTLETERMVLRPYRSQDLHPHHAIVSDPEVMVHFSGPTIGLEDCWRRISASVGSWVLRGFGGWAVVRKEDDRLIGTVGLFNAWRALEPEFGMDPEMGWIFAREVHGQGMAGEACRAALQWADRTLEPMPTWAIIAPTNAPSMALARKLGFERLDDSFYNGEVTAVFRRPPPA